MQNKGLEKQPTKIKIIFRSLDLQPSSSILEEKHLCITYLWFWFQTNVKSLFCRLHSVAKISWKMSWFSYTPPRMLSSPNQRVSKFCTKLRSEKKLSWNQLEIASLIELSTVASEIHELFVVLRYLCGMVEFIHLYLIIMQRITSTNNTQQHLMIRNIFQVTIWLPTESHSFQSLIHKYNIIIIHCSLQ